MADSDGLVEPPAAARRVFVSRPLNFRAVQAVGFDMDYTLVHYRTEEWEQRAYAHARARLLERGLPAEQLRHRPGAFTIGLVVDRLLGNVVNANRFGFIKRAAHGLPPMDFETLRAVYSRVIVDLSDGADPSLDSIPHRRRR